MKPIDYQDPRPIYEQIAAYYKSLILRGVMTTDEKLPSVRSLAVELSTNPNTVQRAFTELERDGFIYSVSGRGNFVRDSRELLGKKKEELIQELEAILKETNELGLSFDELMDQARKSMSGQDGEMK